MLGTVGFMSPEQVRGEAVDPRSDIFSFGAVLFEMLSGVRAFRRDSAVETMNAILKDDPPDLSGMGRGSRRGRAHRAPVPGEARRGPLPLGPRSRARARSGLVRGVGSIARSRRRRRRRSSLRLGEASQDALAGGARRDGAGGRGPILGSRPSSGPARGRRHRLDGGAALRERRRRPGPRVPERRRGRRPPQRALATPRSQGHRAQHELSLQGQRGRPTKGGARSRASGRY